jgi:hypothetical protein
MTGPPPARLHRRWMRLYGQSVEARRPEVKVEGRA